jgi:hypothetical protein
MESEEEGISTVQSSLLTQQQPNACLRFFAMLDVFSFLPVPQDAPVSTRQSIAGSMIFLAIMLGYVGYDLAQFLRFNKPINQAYISPLDDQAYRLPDFALAYMTAPLGSSVNNVTEVYDDMFVYNWTIRTKSSGAEVADPLPFELVTYLNNQSSNFDKIDWLSDHNKQFYYVLRTPSRKDLTSYGLLYSTPETRYIQAKASFCLNGTGRVCKPYENMTQLANYGRFFLFIENEVDDSSVSLEKDFNKDNNFQLYNFFVVPGFYKRVTIYFEVVKTEILPDYFFRFKTEYAERLQVGSVFESTSVVNSLNASNTDAIAFNLQLAPNILHNRVSYSTIIDHVSMWGAFAGVLFSAFAFYFLAFNRRKFYNKNPNWNNFKRVMN